MTVTKLQAIQLGDPWGRGLPPLSGEIHYTGIHDCQRIIGPRGGVKERITRVRPSGQCKTWKRDADRFRIPVKYGLYESAEITDQNADLFHVVEECPIRQDEEREESLSDADRNPALAREGE